MGFLFPLLLLFTVLAFASPVKVGSVNYKIQGKKNLNELLLKVEAWAIRTSSAGAKYLLLPELITFDLLPGSPADSTIPSLLNSIADKAPELEKGLKEIARKNKLTIIGATTLVHHQGKLLNRAYVVRSDGKLQYQDKNYPTPWEIKRNVIGSTNIQIFKGEDFSFAVLICYDSEFPGISTRLVELRPEVIFVPSQTDDAHGVERVRRTSAARAVEHMAYVVLTGAAGDLKAPWHSYIGQNFFFTPQNKYFQGKDIAGKRIEDLNIFEIDIDQLRKARLDRSQIYPARDQGKWPQGI